MSKLDRHTEFLRAYNDYPSQDNEGYIPDRAGFKCGFSAAWSILEPLIKASPPPGVTEEEELQNAADAYARKGFKENEQLVWDSCSPETVQELFPDAVAAFHDFLAGAKHVQEQMDQERKNMIYEFRKRMKAENSKLRALILLTDPAVSSEEMNSLSAKQWAEFARWEKEQTLEDLQSIADSDKKLSLAKLTNREQRENSQ